MHCAAANGHADTLRALIAAGANVDSTDNHGLSPLREAAAAGHTTAVDVLLGAHADVNAKCKQGYTPLHDAAWQGRADCVAALLAHGADPRTKALDSRTPLHCAAQRGHAAVVELLVPGCSAADVSAHDKDGWTPLHKAAQEGHTETVRVRRRRQLGSGNGGKAAGYKRPLSPPLQVLLARGADVNAVHVYASTPLHETAIKGDALTAQVSCGSLRSAPPHSHAPRALPLHQVLLRAGADISAQDHVGHTPLHAAATGSAKKKTAAVAVLLLMAGAGSNAKALDGQVRRHSLPAAATAVASHPANPLFCACCCHYCCCSPRCTSLPSPATLTLSSCCCAGAAT